MWQLDSVMICVRKTGGRGTSSVFIASAQTSCNEKVNWGGVLGNGKEGGMS